MLNTYLRRVPLALRVVLGLSLAAALVLPANAAQIVRAVVLQIEPNGNIYAHNDAYGSMPAMTMEFAVPPGTLLKPGDTINATVDAGHTPELLEHLQVTHMPRIVPVHFTRPIALGDRLPRFLAHDQTGALINLAAPRPQAYAITFIYSRCQDARMCPATSAKLAQVQRRLGATEPRLFAITLDPAYDTPARLAAYAERFGFDPRVVRLLNGSSTPTAKFARRLGVLARPVTGAILHTDRVLLISRSGHVAGFIDDPAWRADDVVQGLRAAEKTP